MPGCVGWLEKDLPAPRDATKTLPLVTKIAERLDSILIRMFAFPQPARPSKARLGSYDAIRITTDEATPPENSSLKSSANKMHSALSGIGLLTRFGYSS